NRNPQEYIKLLNPSGLPSFRLRLKVGCPVILLHNLVPKDSLCNGTRLMVVRCSPRLINAKILTRCKDRNLVFIPRISLTPTPDNLPISMRRR
ncbi:hypothetical protein GIB67_028433, partial [Kingdonia uniflora]